MLMHTSTRLAAQIILGLASLACLGGCVPLVVGGTAATTAVVATDRRTAGEQLDDQTIEIRANNDLINAFSDSARIAVTAYAGRVLLVGDVPNENDKAQAETIVRKIPKVRVVNNYLRVGALTSLSVRTNDTWITSKVKSQLVATKDIPSRTIKIVTERGVVYLMGKVTEDEGRRAAIVASNITGVNKVVKLFDIVSQASVDASAGQSASGTEPSAPVVTEPAPTDSGAQTMPVQ